MRKTIAQLAANPKNPRRISGEKLAALRESLLKFGDLGGIVFNVKTGKLVGGHQRVKALSEAGFDRESVVIEKKFRKPKRNGTVAIGHFEIEGEKLAYREVSWDEKEATAAMIAANKHGGEWDDPMLVQLLKGLEGSDLETLTGFTLGEIEALALPYETGETDHEKLWAGMPEFHQKDKTAHRTLHVHFANEEAFQNFGKLIKQKLTEKTKSIWFPEAEIERYSDKAYVDGKAQ